MPPEARVAIYEDEPSFIKTCKFELEQAGHTVVGVARDMDEAVELLPKLGDLGVEVVLVDGNLSPEADSGVEGMLITEGIKSRHPNIKVIGISMSRPVVGADANMTKTQMTVNRIRKGPTIGDLVTRI